MNPTLESNPPAPDLSALINAYCDGTLTEADAAQLETLLKQDREAMRTFLAYLTIHSRLCWDASVSLSTLEQHPAGRPSPLQTIRSVRTRWSFLSSKPWMFTSAAVLLAVLLAIPAGRMFFGNGQLGAPLVKQPVEPAGTSALATITQANGRWADKARTVKIGEKFSPGMVDLSQGFVEMSFDNGTMLLLEAPIRLQIISDKRAFLHYGRVVARVDHKVTEFTIETPSAKILDLGTEFGTAVDSNGVTQVQVFEGAVEATVKDETGKPQRVERLVAGDARKLDASVMRDWQFVAFHPESFVRKFPAAKLRQGPDMPYNRSQHELLHVAALKNPPTIDGDLSDWKDIPGFTSSCEEPYAENYHVRGMLGYDERFLYIAADVADPAPLRNQVDPAKEQAFFWAGGSVMVRLAANRNIGWPLDAISRSAAPDTRGAGDRPQDRNEQIVHLGLWHSQPEDRSRLQLDYGIGSYRREYDSEGWQGKFRKWDDGRGYTVEYSIPWKLLNSEAPHAGDVWPAMWNVHWSDDEGRRCVGSLTELTNQKSKSPTLLFLDGANWGKVIFDPPQP